METESKHKSKLWATRTTVSKQFRKQRYTSLERVLAEVSNSNFRSKIGQIFTEIQEKQWKHQLWTSGWKSGKQSRAGVRSSRTDLERQSNNGQAAYKIWKRQRQVWKIPRERKKWSEQGKKWCTSKRHQPAKVHDRNSQTSKWIHQNQETLHQHLQSEVKARNLHSNSYW